MEGHQDNDFSPIFYMNYSSNANNQPNPIPVTDPFAHQVMGWPAQPIAIGNNQTATPYQDLLADAIADRSPPNPNNQGPTRFPAGLLAQDRTHPRSRSPPPRIRSIHFQEPSFSYVQHNIDLNEAIENHPGIEGNLSPRTGADLSPFASHYFNSSPLFISSGISGHGVEENVGNGEVGGADGGRPAKRRAPDESSGESSQSMGESLRSRSRSDDDDDDDSEDSDGHYVVTRVRTGTARTINHSGRRLGSGTVVLGLTAPTAAEREENALRNRIMARARQMAEEDGRIRRHIRMRRAMHPTTHHLRELASADIPEEPQPQPQPLPPPPPPQPGVIFPYEHPIHPGLVHPSPPPPPMPLPVPPPVVPNFANYANNTHGQPNFGWAPANFNRHPRPPYVPPAGTTTYTLNGGETVTVPVERSSNRRILLPHEMMQRGSLEQMLTNLNVIPNSPGSNIASSSNSNNVGMHPHPLPLPLPHPPPSPPVQMVPQGNMVDQYGQQMIPVENMSMSEAQARADYCLRQLGIPIMTGGHHVPTQFSVPVRAEGMPPNPPRQTLHETQTALRAIAAAQRRNRLISEVRNALALVRRGGSLQLEDVMVVDRSALYDDDEDDDHEEMRLDVDDMTYEELLDLEERIGSVSTGLTDAVIHARMRHHKYKTMAIGCSYQGQPCCICQEDYIDGEDLGKLDCGHDFHYNCIRQWLFQKNNCPICKMPGLRY